MACGPLPLVERTRLGTKVIGCSYVGWAGAGSGPDHGDGSPVYQTRHSSTAQSFLDGSAPSKMAARSASASSGGTTTNTDTPGSASTPQPPSTSATPTASESSANVCSEPRTPLTPNVLFARRQS